MTDIKPRQKLFHILGESGCYFLSILHSAERVIGKYIDAYCAFLLSLTSKYIQDDCFVTMPAEMLSWMTGEKWTMTKEANDYPCVDGEIEILRYEWQEISTLHGHFVCGDGNGGIEYDPYGDSLTVKNGRLVSKRIFRRVT